MIDAHFHCWQLARGDYGWLTPELSPIYRDVSVAEWQRHAQRWGIQGGVLVQAAPTAQETEFLLQQAQAKAQEQAQEQVQAQPHPTPPAVWGVVGWIDMLAPDAVAQVERCAERPLLKGLRPMLQDLPDPDWILQPAIQPVLSAMARRGLVFDALIKPVHLPRILALTQAHPDLTVVVDHGAKPAIDTNAMAQWAADLSALARATSPERVVCKMSGLLTEVPSTEWVAEGAGAAAMSGLQDRMRPWCQRLLDIWGPQRLLWGSDWPVLDLAASYDAWRELTMQVLAGLTAQEQAAILGENARRIYRLSN